MNKWKLFISHSWDYDDQYCNLEKLLKEANYFDFQNYSVPKNDPIHNTNSDRELRIAIQNQIRFVDAVIIIAGVYSTYRKWINIEIEIAKEMGKKIIAVEPWGSEKTSTFVKDNADFIVGWNAQSIIKAIKGY